MAIANGLRVSSGAWVIVGALACGPSHPLPGEDTDGEAGDTTAGSLDPDGDSGDVTTRSEPAVPPGDASGTTSSADTTDGDTGWDDPEITCAESACASSCTYPVVVRDETNGGECICDGATAPPDYLACELPRICVERGNLCAIQALRYGVFGIVDSDVEIDILEPGRARFRSSGTTHDCCGEVFVNEYAEYGHPRGVAAPEDARWNECLVQATSDDRFAGTPDCLQAWGVGRPSTCEGPLTVCPPPPPPVDPSDCTAACPMADDGVCDEEQGTGLCATGCDPIDCTCIGDVPGRCDEPSRGGTCPFGADPDDCG